MFAKAKEFVSLAGIGDPHFSEKVFPPGVSAVLVSNVVSPDVVVVVVVSSAVVSAMVVPSPVN